MYGAKPCMGNFWSGAARLAFLFRLGTGKEGPPLSPAAGMGGGERKQAVQIKQQQVGVGLSMDAFAVAICRGLSMKKLEWKQALLVAVFFGGFQALMPTIGWVLGKQFEQYIVSVDHWIAFILLAYIGGKMIWDAFHEEEARPADFRVGELLIMAVATSIDALAVGITFAFLEVSILPAVCFIAATTFLLSCIGVKVGNLCGTRFQSKAELLGGIILILLGLKILLEHLGVL